MAAPLLNELSISQFFVGKLSVYYTSTKISLQRGLRESRTRQQAARANRVPTGRGFCVNSLNSR